MFNPSTGFCKRLPSPEVEARPQNTRKQYIKFTLYTLPTTDNDVTDIQYNNYWKGQKEGKAVETINFDNVHLVIGRGLTGPLYTYPCQQLSFTINQAEISAFRL